MWQNHLKTAWRNLLRHPGYASLNITGLALSIAAAFVLLLFVRQETSYDKHFANSDRIFRIASDFYNMGGFARTSEALYRWLKDDCKEARYITAVDVIGNDMPVEVDGATYTEGKGLAVDSSFFRVFSLDLLAGSPRHLMQTPDEVVLSERLAEKYFGNASALGETIRVGKDRKPYRVTGIVKDDRRKTHMKADLFLPIEFKNKENWTSSSIFVYLMLHDRATPAQLEQSLERLKRDRIYPTFPNESSYESWASGSHRVDYFIQPLRDIYLHSKFRFDLTPGGNPQQVAVLGIIGLFLIFIALVNYVNLTTARSSVRAKEVGVKKTLGAGRRTLAGQFLTESLLTCLLAMALAGGLAEGLLSVFEHVTGQPIVESLFSDKQNLLWLAAISVVSGLLAGLYPAAYLTRFQPVHILKGLFTLSGNRQLRGGLVVFQFTIAIGLIIGSLVVYHQLRYMQQKDKGFEQEGVLIVNNIRQLGERAEAFREEIARFPQVASTSFNDRVPADDFLWMYTYQTPEMEESITLQTFPADEQYLPTLGLRLLRGRNFSKDIASDTAAVILNQAAVEALGLTGRDPIGAEVNKGYRVIGVVQDFNFQSLREKIEPAVMAYGPQGHRLALKLKGAGMAGFLSRLETTWRTFSPEEPIRYTFLDDNFARLAATEKMLGQAVGIFTALAIFIACLGLFGLAAFMAEQRTKEIGIRKVLGASISGIVRLLSKDFLKLVLIALILASPIGYYVMDKWLQDFAYRIRIEWWVFALAGAAALVIAALTVSFQSLKAALANPVKALRSE